MRQAAMVRRRRTLLGLMLLPLAGCTSLGPSALQKGPDKARTEAAAGLAVVPNAAQGTQTCDYDTPAGHVTVTISIADKCPLKPPPNAGAPPSDSGKAPGPPGP